MTATGVKTVHVFVSGRVQGVWFRGWTQKHAKALGLSGWVRNLRDGRVEAVFSGASADVDAMLDKCLSGPPAAKVTSVEKQVMEPDQTIIGFEPRPTV